MEDKGVVTIIIKEAVAMVGTQIVMGTTVELEVEITKGARVQVTKIATIEGLAVEPCARPGGGRERPAAVGVESGFE